MLTWCLIYCYKTLTHERAHTLTHTRVHIYTYDVNSELNHTNKLLCVGQVSIATNNKNNHKQRQHI